MHIHFMVKITLRKKNYDDPSPFRQMQTLLPFCALLPHCLFVGKAQTAIYYFLILGAFALHPHCIVCSVAGTCALLMHNEKAGAGLKRLVADIYLLHQQVHPSVLSLFHPAKHAVARSEK